ncbi:MAG: M48 family metalloprotease [Syntrophorhabdaceae bacterium]|nr:M48 family metalloprotease [Syntrophorhabdaceae bacterium]
MKTRFHLTVLVAMSAALLWGCVVDDAARVGAASGVITKEQAQSISRSADAVSKAAEDFTPEQEYYIGRSVGAVIVSKYKPYNDSQANDYINLIGRMLAQMSDRPETFSGYRFQILDSNEINAFAAPGGLIFVTREMLRLCKNEDEIAAVLAHEIAHVEFNHGIQAISKSRKVEALKVLAIEGTKAFGKQELANLTSTFESSIGDITATMISNGYSRAFEREADASAVKILSRVGYDPAALAAMLREMEKRLKPGGADFVKTHPSPASRISELPASARGQFKESPARRARFEKAKRYF